MDEVSSAYLFIIFYCWLENRLARLDKSIAANTKKPICKCGIAKYASERGLLYTRRVLINFPLAIFIISLAGVAITTVAAALRMTFHDYLPVPFYDEWDELSRWEAVKKTLSLRCF